MLFLTLFSILSTLARPIDAPKRLEIANLLIHYYRALGMALSIQNGKTDIGDSLCAQKSGGTLKNVPP
jgi:hypothetical protein